MPHRVWPPPERPQEEVGVGGDPAHRPVREVGQGLQPAVQEDRADRVEDERSDMLDRRPLEEPHSVRLLWGGSWFIDLFPHECGEYAGDRLAPLG